MRKLFRSIRSQIILLVLTCVLFPTLTLALVTLYNVSNGSVRSAGRNMNLICQTQGTSLDIKMHDVKKDVDAVRGLAESLVRDLDTIKAEDLPGTIYDRVGFKDMIYRDFSNIAAQTKGDLSFYLYFNPDLIDTVDGFLYIKPSDHADAYEKNTLTDIRSYDTDDLEHTAWYWEPVNAGTGTWIEPYENKNLDAYIITYAAPFYYEGTLVGIVGMDINYSVIEDEVSQIKAYNTGYAFLTSADGRLMYHPYLDYRSQTYMIMDDLGITVDRPSTADTEMIRYMHNDRTVKYLAFRTLSNGMKFVVCAPKNEILQARDELLRQIMAICFVLVIWFTLVGIVYAKLITTPLAKISQAAKSIADGNLDTELAFERTDEIGELADNLKVTAEHLKEQIEYASRLAYKDALTHVNNKTAYDQALARIDKKILSGKAAFAIVMCDINELKRINDSYGHEAGDDIIGDSCRVICNLFKHSPVFRIGGDEFAIILEGQDFENREKIIEELRTYNKPRNYEEVEPWHQVSVACGISTYNPEEDQESMDVFRRADAEMYANKKQFRHLSKEE